MTIQCLSNFTRWFLTTQNNREAFYCGEGNCVQEQPDLFLLIPLESWST